MYGLETLFYGLLHTFCIIATDCLQPQILGALIISFVDSSGSSVITSDAYLYAAGIVLCALINVIAKHSYLYFVSEIAMKLKIGSTGLVYKKVSR
jgi:ATP-binding cassette subfamily C (CFTR/MRP) protein 4